MKTPSSQHDLLQSLVKGQQDEGRNELWFSIRIVQADTVLCKPIPHASLFYYYYYYFSLTASCMCVISFSIPPTHTPLPSTQAILQDVVFDHGGGKVVVSWGWHITLQFYTLGSISCIIGNSLWSSSFILVLYVLVVFILKILILLECAKTFIVKV